MKIRFPAVLAMLAVLSSGCAYQMGSIHEPGFKTIFIENFRSHVDEPALESLVTTTVIKQFQKDGTLQVTDEDKADVVMRAVIDKFDMTAVLYSRQNEITPTQTTMTLGVSYTLTKRGDTKPYFHGKAEGQASFFIGNDLQSDKRQGIPLASEVLGRNLVRSLADGW